MSTLHNFPNDDVVPPQPQPQLPPPPPPPPPPRRHHRRNRRPPTRRRRPSTTDPTTTDGGSSLGEVESSSDEFDVESGELEMKVHCWLGDNNNNNNINKKQCRICHLNFEGGCVIELGCDCKGDLGAAHKQCAETWFKIKGNMTCEICGATAQNVAGEQINEMSQNTTETEPAATGPMVVPTEPQLTFWRGRRIMNILLGCMVFAFIISCSFTSMFCLKLGRKRKLLRSYRCLYGLDVGSQKCIYL